MKFLKYLFVFLLICCCMISCGSEKKDSKPKYTQEEIDGFKSEFQYEGSIEDYDVTITKYIGSKNEVSIPYFVTTIGESTFKDCKNLINITIPNSVKTIKQFAFINCNGLESLVLPDSVEIIEKKAIMNCSKLKDVTLGKNLLKIEDFNFYNCSKLENIYYRGTIEKWCNMDIYQNPMSYAEHFYMLNNKKEWYEVTNIVIPNGIKNIKAYTFVGFEYLESITIPVSVKEIGISAFDVENVYYLGTLNEWDKINIIYEKAEMWGETIYYGYALENTKHFYIQNSNNEWIDVIDQVKK